MEDSKFLEKNNHVPLHGSEQEGDWAISKGNDKIVPSRKVVRRR